MSEVLAARIAFGGVIVGVLLTWISGYLLKIQEAKIQREQAKFTSFHAKQGEVLAHIYREVARSGISLGIINEHLIKIHQQYQSRDPDEQLVTKIIGFISSNFTKAKTTSYDLKLYLIENDIYIDDIYTNQVNNILEKYLILIQNSLLEDKFFYEANYRSNIIYDNKELLSEVDTIKGQIREQVKKIIAV